MSRTAKRDAKFRAFIQAARRELEGAHEKAERNRQELEMLEAKLFELSRSVGTSGVEGRVRFLRSAINDYMQSSKSPPAAAEKFLIVATAPGRVDEVLGDFEEDFHRVADRHGSRFAKACYWWWVMQITAARILDLAKRFALMDLLRRFIS
jgi:cell division septum initiation protein DivIVA